VISDGTALMWNGFDVPRISEEVRWKGSDNLRGAERWNGEERMRRAKPRHSES